VISNEIETWVIIILNHIVKKILSSLVLSIQDYDSEMQSDHIPVKLTLNEFTEIENEEICY
jgi:hypothetical protein